MGYDNYPHNPDGPGGDGGPDLTLPSSGESDIPQNVVSLFPVPPKKLIVEEPIFEEEEFEGEATKVRNNEQLTKARKRQEVFFKKRRATKKWRVFSSRLKVILRLTFCLLLTVGLYLLAHASFWKFTPKDANLYGNQLLTRAQIQPYVAALSHKPLYAVNPVAMEETIRQRIPLVDSVYIRRRLFPIGIDIAVSEKPSWGMIYTKPPEEVKSELKAEIKPTDEKKPDTEEATAATQTDVLPASNADDSVKPAVITTAQVFTQQPVYLVHYDNTVTDLANYPKLTPQLLSQMGSPIPIVSSQMWINKNTLKHYQEVIRLLNSRPDLAKLQYLDVSNPFDVYAYFDGFKLRIGRVDTSTMERLARFFPIVPTVRERQSNIDFVDLRWREQIILKEKNGTQVKS